MRLVVGRGVLDSLGEEVSRLNPHSVFLVTDDVVAELHLDKVLEALGDTRYLVLGSGEEIKSLNVLKRIWRWLLRFGATRKSLLVALGGGTVLDVGGFAASTYMRGMLLANVPTTLLAQADAAVGGKNGVNYMGKNMIGSFYEPHLVVADVSLLETLNRSALLSGLAEIIKHGVIGDEELFSLLERKGFSALEEDAEFLVRRSIEVKMSIVSRDPREENGLRMVLNLGHTVGHALELLSRYSIQHGFAVSIGMVASCLVAEEVNGFDETDRVIRLLENVGLPTRFELGSKGVERVISVMKRDKKAWRGGIVMVLPVRIGRVEVRCVKEDPVRKALRMVLS